MANIFTKDELLTNSPAYVGGKILSLLENSETGEVSIFEAAENLIKSNSYSVKSIYCAMIFLYSVDLLEFKDPYLVLKCSN
ncbi:hypothetical protein SAMN04488540_108144 [Ferrimonas sediminum]|uniref:Uncharacterized protein n=1 Tax=Ferrimonas sediminum TaxID=718193 RepID=A0A1G8U2S4_9GAMM|nr:hypothetical protein SAMN04488540_108144 [Ferrimonas sediminum]